MEVSRWFDYNDLVKMMEWPVVVMREGSWYVAACPPLDIATQGKTEQEVKDNMKELIHEYLRDPDTPKPKGFELVSFSLISAGSGK